MIKNRIDLITMGCSKNLVDSERLMGQLAACGYKMFHDADDVKGEIVIVNTCGFIGDAKEESINMILELCEAKKRHKIGQIFVMGCLSERYRTELLEEIPEIDRIYGKFDWKQILADLGHRWDDSLKAKRFRTTPSHYEYVKIGEGCNRMCAYCAIPLITGRYKSRPIEEIVEEIRSFVANGVHEFQLIAQDLTGYGKDLYGRFNIAELVEQIAQIPGVEWIRLHYAYPNDFPLDLLPVMAKYPNVCKYLDIALQHASDHVLDRMLRHVTCKETEELLARIRKEVPGIHLRTTLMVGFPGETEEDFEFLVDFVKRQRFERMGAFAYSEEDGTYSARHYEDDVPADVKQSRLDALMAVQEEITTEIQEEKVGKVLKVVIDRKEGDYYVGRTEYDSPEVDLEVLIAVDSCEMKVGKFYNVKIKSASVYELIGELVNE
ncbi:MAG: 30S ribosomal protein S12 methylthiotransferase RimO [Bacteroidales bacterium]|nr:30S ribosomal protein S12 methylthiotransferase RimO [Bacteroidales bacterium]